MASLMRTEMCLQGRPRPGCVAELAPARPHLPLPRVESAGKERMDGRGGGRAWMRGQWGSGRVRVLDYRED